MIEAGHGVMLITRLHFRQGMRRIYASPRKSFSTFAFTLSSILISGGQGRLIPSPGKFLQRVEGDQGRLKPSPGNFFVASTPSLLPMVPQARDSWRGRARRPGSVINSASFPSFQNCRNQAILYHLVQDSLALMPLGAARRLFQSDTIPNVAKRL